MIERWREWIAAFDQCCADDQWQRLEPFLAENVTYSVSGAAYPCHLQGRQKVIDGFASSIRNFDRHFDERQWHGIGIREYPPSVITGRAVGVYRKGDLPVLSFSAKSIWQFDGDMLIAMSDMYDPAEIDVQQGLAWLAEHGAGMDPSYG
ncbi:MAG: hypothetical protein AAFX04_11250 [Pseudomonadota bacterium]